MEPKILCDDGGVRLLAALGVALLLGVATAGCGGDDETTPAETTRALVYLVRGNDLGAAAREISTGDGMERAAVEELLSGPTKTEAAAGLATWIAPDVTLASVEIEDGVATVDLAGLTDDPDALERMLAGGLSQVVFTLTQFPGVDGVRFLTDGDPLHDFDRTGAGHGVHHRSDFEEQSPHVLVERPVVGDVVTSPVHLQGTANTFEATFEYEVLSASGQKLAGTFVTATCGTGCRGTFEEEVPFETGDAKTITLVVFERSAKDGSRVNEVRIPLALG